ncbi:MAG TPA: hypothetical protein VHY58_18045 [Streptosporangiaceae bacterium]|nr:hypothetical protein [Streptosporangiaceae bacterium]
MRITFRVAALVAAAALPLAMASSASAAPAPRHPVFGHAASIRPANVRPASTGGRAYIEGLAGYLVSGAQFRLAAQSTYLRNPDQYADITNGLDEGVILVSSDWEIDISVGADTTTVGEPYGPAFYVYQGDTQVSGPYGNGMWCPVGGSCAPLADGEGFAVGATVRQSVYYDQATGTVDYSATDTAGNRAYGSYSVGKGVAFYGAILGGGWGDFTAPAAATKLFAFSGAALTTYSGHHSGLSSWFSHSKVIGTSDGTSTGTVQGEPTDLASNGSAFSVNLEPAPVQPRQ